MIWSKLKKQIESGFADELKGKIQIYLTTYANSQSFMGRGWITYNGIELSNFSNNETFMIHGSYSNELCDKSPGPPSHQPINNSDRIVGNLVEKGEFSKYDFGGSCWEFINMTIKDAQTSKNPLLRTLAILDKRTGKRSLSMLEKTESHPLVKKMIAIRLSL
jgi:hypothetical protein